MAEQLRAGGADEAVIEQFVERELQGCEEFEVYKDNWDVVSIFLRLRTQWQIVLSDGHGKRWEGLRYESVERYLTLMDVPDIKGTFVLLQIMESAAMSVLNARRGK